jgi:hypothetical protein
MLAGPEAFARATHVRQSVFPCPSDWGVRRGDTTPEIFTVNETYRELWRHAVAQLVKALCYKPEGRGIESR